MQAIAGGNVPQPKITIEVEGWHPLSNVLVDQSEVVNTYVLHPLWRSSAVRLSVTVVEDRGVRMVTLGSPSEVENCFSMPLEL